MLEGIGAIGAKKLIVYCGGAEAVFKEKKAALLKIPSIGQVAAKTITSSSVFDEAEQEIEFIQKNNITSHFYLNNTYPQRLLHCEDGPVMLYTKGNMKLNAQKVISIVGTRKATVKRKAFTEKLTEEIALHNPIIVSGLAYGVDICAHKAALKNNSETIGVLACGLDDIYPKAHFSTSEKILQQGGLVSDYKSGTKLFPTQMLLNVTEWLPERLTPLLLLNLQKKEDH